VAPRLADPNQKPFDVRFVPAPPIADDGSVEGPAPQLTTRTSLNKDAGKMPPSPEDSAVFSLMGKANDAVSTGDLKQAIVLLSDVLDFQPSHLNARLSRGRCWRELGEFSAALSDFHRAQDSAPMSAAPTYEVANLFFAQKAYNKAIDAYGSAIELDEEHAMAHCRRGICHHFRGHPESAKRDLLEATRLNAEIPNIRRYLRMVDKRNG
jgi:tetratricopeptide (TPR) repeat protein